jgi:hypothetical protein
VKVMAEVVIQVVGMVARTKGWQRDWEAKAVLVLDWQEGAVERRGAHVAYIVIVVGKAHMQFGQMYQKKQHGPILSSKYICLCGPMKTC